MRTIHLSRSAQNRSFVTIRQTKAAKKASPGKKRLTREGPEAGEEPQRAGHSSRRDWKEPAKHSRQADRDAPHEDAPHKNAPHKDAPHKDAPYKDAPYKDAPYKDAPYKTRRKICQGARDARRDMTLRRPKRSYGHESSGTSPRELQDSGPEAGVDPAGFGSDEDTYMGHPLPPEASDERPGKSGTPQPLTSEAASVAEQLRRLTPSFKDGDIKTLNTGEYHERNFELFRLRDKLRDSLKEYENVDRRALPAADRVRARRLEAQLERVTEELVSFNYGLVVKIVRRFSSRKTAEDSADFEQAGVVGLMRAIQKYEVERGAKFSSFAHIQILGEVLRSVRFNDFANMSQVDFDSRLTILKAQESLALENPEGPSFEQIAEAAGVNVTQVARVLNPPRMQSIHTPVGEEGDSELGDLLPDADAGPETEVLVKMAVEQVQRHGLSVLNERELFVLGRRFGLDGEPRQNLQQLGDMLGLSREAVRQQEMKALAKLNHPSVLYHMLVE